MHMYLPTWTVFSFIWSGFYGVKETVNCQVIKNHQMNKTKHLNVNLRAIWPRNTTTGFFIRLTTLVPLSKNNFAWKATDKFRLKYVC